MLKLLFLHPLFCLMQTNFHYIGLRENLQESIGFRINCMAWNSSFSLKAKLEDWGNDSSMYSRTAIWFEWALMGTDDFNWNGESNQCWFYIAHLFDD